MKCDTHASYLAQASILWLLQQNGMKRTCHCYRKMKLTTRVCVLFFVCFIAPPESVEGFTGSHRAVTVNHEGKRRLATMMVDSKMEGISERNAKLLAQAERLRAEGL
tara:strand:+ start:426 stop:746 length:321 start_codon:yes stop_codon:yes gene_type:complete